jgi:hypothetical protein
VNNSESKDIIKRKLIADLIFHNNCGLIKQEMGIIDLKQWIETNI